MQSLGYREMAALVRGEAGFERTLEAIIRRTWQYARRQRTWFRRMTGGFRLRGHIGRRPERISPSMGWAL